MAREAWAYREVAVESFVDPRSGRVAIRPIPGQAYASALRVQCSSALKDQERYPVGTRFLVSAKLTDRQGGAPYLYAHHGDAVKVLAGRELESFLDEYRRRRI
jgi:hypothetical protein